MHAEQLLAPVSALQPTGINIREDEANAPLYYRLKDARTSARIAERQADAEAERGPIAPEWRSIFDLAQDILRNHSKDLEVAVWLTEAAIRLRGFAGLLECFTLLDGLIERYWETLHSVDTQDLSAKVAPLAGLNGVGSDGALIQPLRLAAITAPASGEPAGLWHYMVTRRRADSAEGILLAAAAKNTDTPSFKSIYSAITGSLTHFESMSNRLDLLCGIDSPPSSTIRNTLIEAADALRDVSGLGTETLGEVVGPAHAEPEGASTPDSEKVAAIVAATVPVAPTEPVILHSREDALRELSRIATFFQEHEPNSPTGFTLETLIRRARLPLGELLQELIPDVAVRQAYLSAAGIKSLDVG